MSPRREDPRQQRRRQVAQEAARLLAETGQGELEQARRKAAARLGVRDEAALPGAGEIREALREHQRLFGGGGDPSTGLRRQREAALEAMGFFVAFQPRLAGPILDGTGDGRSAVCLHLHVDDPDAVAHLLHEQRIPAEQASRRLRLDAGRAVAVPAWHFEADGIAFELLVLPATALRQPPLEPVDGKPMERASASALRRLLDAGAG